MPIFMLMLVNLILVALPCPATENAITLDLGHGAAIELVLVQPGRFLQGSPTSESGRGDDEMQREVAISAPLYVGKYPVTRGQFAAFVADTGYRTEAERGTSGGFGLDGTQLVQRQEFNWQSPGFPQTDEHPMCLVTYDDALAFCRWATGKTGRALDLPTEAQWEYACRAGTTGAHHAGEDGAGIDAIAWLGGAGTHPVGQKQPNAVGLHDLVGHVWQWCRDWYAPYEVGPVEDPDEQRSDRSDKPRRVLRGGSFLKQAKHCRSAARYRNDPGSRNADNGFRVIASVSAAGKPRNGATPPPGSPAEWEPGQGTSRIWLHLIWIAIVLVIARQVVRRVRRGRQQTLDAGHAIAPPRSSPAQRVRPVADGFWFDAPAALRGQIAKYRCTLRGKTFASEFVIEPGPGGQFVYTGATPVDVLILGLTQGPSPHGPLSHAADLTETEATDLTIDDPPSSSHHVAPHSFPSAY